MTRKRLPSFARGLFVLAIMPALAQTPLTEIVLHSFGGDAPLGANPYGGLVRDAAGNFYGTATVGGAAGYGVVFKVDATGHTTVLYSFSGLADGANPGAGVVRDKAGNLYGTTTNGGAGYGVVFKLDTTGHETVLHTFTGGVDGAGVETSIILDEAGNVYGATSTGGTLGWGKVYKLDPAGEQTVLYNFTREADGGCPNGSLTRDRAGNLYGTGACGGNGSAGVVYKLNAAGHLTVLYTFDFGADGGSPYSGVVRDAAGNLYGTTINGGAGYGVVFKVDPAGHETVLHTFTGGADGEYPQAGLTLDPQGNLIGTTPYGGLLTGSCPSGCGVVFKITQASNFTVVHSFTGADGADPYAAVIVDAAGNLYGTTRNGGAGNWGAVFEVDAAGNETTLHSFAGSPDGQKPYTGLVRDAAGNLYGTTRYGGSANAGVVFQVDTTGHAKPIYSFQGAPDGFDPLAGLTLDAAGNLYGTTVYGGSGNAGIVYKLDPAGHETILHNFAGGTDGANPVAGVVLDAAGNIYGATNSGGAANAGVVYKLDPAGNETLLYSFTGGADGGNPESDLILDPAGNLYGTAYFGGVHNFGVVYEVDPTRRETVLYSFTGGGGAYPTSGVIRDAAGNLYGTTLYGGEWRAGVVYRVDPSGKETVLHRFTGNSDGGSPDGGLVMDRAGNLFGTALFGGSGWGVVYRLEPPGRLTVLYSSAGPLDGANPSGRLIIDPAGNLIGTTQNGGTQSNGVVFELKAEALAH